MKQRIVIVLITLVIGGGIGYLIGGSMNETAMSETTQTGSSPHGSAPDAMLAELSNLNGSDRDEAFLESMIVHHQSAVEMSKLILETTRREELKQLAENIIAAQNTEIATMQGWLRDWYGR